MLDNEGVVRMPNWIPLLFTAIFAIAMVGGGLFLWKCPPKNINGLIGYRTKRSMQNQESWDFAQRYAGKVWVISGVLDACVFLPLSFLPFDDEGWGPILFLLAQAFVLLLVCPVTQHALKIRFG